MEINERVHAYLDGEIPREALTPGERAAALEFERWSSELRADADAAVEALRVSGSNDLASRVIAEVNPRPDPFGGLAPWLFGRRRLSFNFRPVYAVAAVLLIAVAIGFGLPSFPGGTDEISSATGSQAVPGPTVFVRFELTAPDASTVQLAGSFSGWSPDVSLEPVGDGRWSALVPLHPGVHDYAFRIDGERWVVDPYSPRVADGFGGYNSRLSLVVSGS